MIWRKFGWVCVLLLYVALPACCHTIRVKGNRIWLDSRKGQILYKSSGDLDRDGRRETVWVAQGPQYSWEKLVVARVLARQYEVVEIQDIGYEGRADITDINGDGKLELVTRTMSGDGHLYCGIDVLKDGKLVSIGEFRDTHLVDLSGDGVPEILSISPISFMFTGDHWLTIYKWNGKGYTDVSRRFPKTYDAVIQDLKKTIHQLRYTKDFGSRHDISDHADIFADFYYYLGQAYEYRRLPDKAKVQYAIAYRLEPDNEETAKAFRRAYHLSKRANLGK